jgi:predicted extracellular nuclease
MPNVLRTGSALVVATACCTSLAFACPAPLNALHDISAVQGPGALSPMAGQTVTIRGVVTGEFQGDGKLKGFFMQQAVPDQDARTSEGIFVFAPASQTKVAPGQLVQVSGTVEEFKSGSGAERATQLGSVTTIELCGPGAAIAPRALNLPFADSAQMEALEGMLVELTQELTVSDTHKLGRFGELSLAAGGRMYTAYSHPSISDPAAVKDLNERSQIVLDDGSGNANPSPTPYFSAAGSAGTRRTGDTLKGLLGVLTWGQNAWRIHPLRTPVFINSARPLVPPAVGGSLRAGSLNVLNFFTTPGGRGADTAVELVRQRDKLVSTIAGLDADVLGLMEIENNPTTSIGALVEAVNARMGAGTYGYITGTPGNDDIKVAIIYKRASVKPVGDAQIPDDPGFLVTGKLRPPMAQRFAAHAGKGGFWMVVNHFKSKGSCPRRELPDAEHGQGCWNPSRVRQANLLTAWTAQLAATSGEPDVLMVGDYNAYLNEDPIKAIEAAGFENLLRRLPPAARYSYVYDGESGALDYAFASASMRAQVKGVAEWHINADEPTILDYNTEFKPDDRYAPTPFRSSDHDPVLVGLSLAAD